MPFIDEFFADSAPGPPYWDVPVFLAQFPILRRPVTELTSHFYTRILAFFLLPPPTLNFLSQNSLKFISLPSVFSPGSRLLGNHSLFNLFKLLTSASLCPHHYFPEFIQLSHWFIRQTHNRNIIQMWWAFSLSCSELYHNVLEHTRSTEFLDQRADACWWFTSTLCFPGGWREHSEQHGWVDPSWSRLWESLY